MSKYKKSKYLPLICQSHQYPEQSENEGSPIQQDDINQLQDQNQEKEDKGFFDDNEYHMQSHNHVDNPFLEQSMLNNQISNVIQQEQNQKCTITANTVQLEQVQQIQEEKKKKVDNGQVETKNLPASYARSIKKAIKRRKDMYISASCNKALQKIADKKGAITLKALREFLTNEEIGKFSKTYFSSFQFVDDILSSSKQKDINAPLKYLKNVYQGCFNPNSLKNWK